MVENNETISEDKSAREKENDSITEAELMNFYIELYHFEIQLRNFIKMKLGKNWQKIIEKDLPKVIQGWNEKFNKDLKWMIDPEEDVMNYADLGDYLAIIEKKQKMLDLQKDRLNAVTTKLRDWYNCGRNPVMHVRTLTRDKIRDTQSAMNCLLKWMNITTDSNLPESLLIIDETLSTEIPEGYSNTIKEYHCIFCQTNHPLAHIYVQNREIIQYFCPISQKFYYKKNKFPLGEQEIIEGIYNSGENR